MIVFVNGYGKISKQSSAPFLKIELNSYSLKDAETAIIQKCIADNPTYTYDQLANLFGISSRTLYRTIKSLNEEGYDMGKKTLNKRGKHAKK